MKLIVYFTFASILIKDIGLLGDRYILRGVSQITCLLVGLYYFFLYLNIISLRKYWMLICYFIAINISVFSSCDIYYSGLQVISWGSVILFFIVYHEIYIYIEKEKDKNNNVINFITWMTNTLCFVSLIAAIIWSNRAFITLPGENISRFRGLFSTPAMMATNAGLALGFTIFSDKNKITKILITLVCSICIFLTYSRTFWIATLISILFVYWWSYKNRRIKPFLILCYILVLFILINMLVSIDISGEKILRVNSIKTLTGRTKIWKDSLELFKKRPFRGFGFLTSENLIFKKKKTSLFLTKQSETHKKGIRSLHNGFIQVLVDTGIWGAIFYILILSKAFLSTLFSCKSYSSKLKIPLYTITFFFISNLGESTLYSAATFFSVVGWYFIVYGLSLNKDGVEQLE